MKKRILISQIATLVLLFAAKPESWGFFIAGLALMSLGQAVRIAASAAIVKSETLTTSGPYAAVRNPLYLGTMLMTGGLVTMLTAPARPLLSAGLWLFAVASFGWIYYVTIKREEEFLLGIYGKVFENYVASVPCLLPVKGLSGFFNSAAYSRGIFARNKEWRGITAAVALAAFIALRINYGF